MPTTDEPRYIIRLGVGRPPRAECSCGWKTESTEDLYELGTQAFKHRDETGHQLRKLPQED